MKTKHLVILLIIGIFSSLFNSSCRTREQQAQKLLQRAINKDPKILQNTTKDTVITGFVTVLDTIHIQGTNADVLLDCDSLKKLFEKEGAPVNKEGNKSAVLYTDSAKSLEVYKSGNKIFARITTPADTIYINKAVPYRVEVKTPAQLITEYVNKPAYYYFWFWVFIAIFVVILWLGINRLFFKKDYVGQVLKRDQDGNNT